MARQGVALLLVCASVAALAVAASGQQAPPNFAFVSNVGGKKNFELTCVDGKKNKPGCNSICPDKCAESCLVFCPTCRTFCRECLQALLDSSSSSSFFLKKKKEISFSGIMINGGDFRFTARVYSCVYIYRKRARDFVLNVVYVCFTIIFVGWHAQLAT